MGYMGAINYTNVLYWKDLTTSVTDLGKQLKIDGFEFHSMIITLIIQDGFEFHSVIIHAFFRMNHIWLTIHRTFKVKLAFDLSLFTLQIG